jgi:hypothetical protein
MMVNHPMCRKAQRPTVMALLLASLLLATGAAGSAVPPDTQTHAAATPVYVFTAQAGTDTPSEDEQGRLDAVRDVRDALRHHSEITLVDSAEAARVTVEVVERERREGGEGGFGGKSVTQFGDVIVRLRVKADKEETEIKGMAPGYWSKAAKDAADRVVKWVQRYRSHS